MAIPTVVEIAGLGVDALPPRVLVPRLTRAFDVTIRPPGSKSITNRALLLAALAEGQSVLRGALVDADDARVMIRALEQLGAQIRVEQSAEDAMCGNATLHVTGVAGRWKPRERNPVLNLQNAGTATRFLTAAAVLSDPAMGPVTIDGNARMRERPIGELVGSLRELGVRVECERADGFPPLRVYPPANMSELNNCVTIRSPKSSQFVSALVLVSPLWGAPLEVRIEGHLPSSPYVAMSESLLSEFCWRALGVRPRAVLVGGSPTSRKIYPVSPVYACDFEIEPDASGASYWLAAAALIAGSRLTLPAIDFHTTAQGDADFLRVLMGFSEHFGFKSAGLTEVAFEARGGGTLEGVDVGFDSIPDTAMTAAVVACFASPTPENPTATTTLRGLKTLRVKETDRLAALQTELSKLGAQVEIITTRDDEALQITPPPDVAASPLCLPASVAPPAPVEFDTYDDHRMAMSLALIGLRRGNIIIRDPACVRKTYPTFWRDLAKLYQ